MQPSLIRVEADEATYNLHIILRFELEQEMLAGVVPARAAARGVEPADVGATSASRCRTTRAACSRTRTGRAASLGYFPTYALGNLISAQLWERILADLPDLTSSSSAASSAPLREWLREHLHRHGRKFTPAETLERAIGATTIDPEPYVRYLQREDRRDLRPACRRRVAG